MVPHSLLVRAQYLQREVPVLESVCMHKHSANSSLLPSVETALAAYKNGAGGIFGGTGIGDILFCGAAPAIVALGFSLYEQRLLLRRNLVPIVGGSTITGFSSRIRTPDATSPQHRQPPNPAPLHLVAWQSLPRSSSSVPIP